MEGVGGCALSLGGVRRACASGGERRGAATRGGGGGQLRSAPRAVRTAAATHQNAHSEARQACQLIRG